MRSYLLNTVAPRPFVLAMANTEGGGTVTPLPRGGRRGRGKGAVLDRVTYHAFSPVPEYEANEEFATLEAYADYLIDLYDEIHADANTELSVEEVVSIIRQVEGDSPDAEAKRLEVMEASSAGGDEEAEDTAPSAVRSAGIHVGAKLDAETGEHMSAVENANEALDGSALLIALDFERSTTAEER